MWGSFMAIIEERVVRFVFRQDGKLFRRSKSKASNWNDYLLY